MTNEEAHEILIRDAKMARGDEVRQGRCGPCKTAYIWPASKCSLRGAACIRCGTPLTRTVWSAKLPWVPLAGGPRHRHRGWA